MKNYTKKIKDFFSKAGSKVLKREEEVILIQRKTKGLHGSVLNHWRLLKLMGVLVVSVVAFFQYSFHQKVNDEAFQSVSEVAPVGAKNIEADKLFSVLTKERSRSKLFSDSLAAGPVSFDPSKYDLFLSVQDEDIDNPVSTSTSDTSG